MSNVHPLPPRKPRLPPNRFKTVSRRRGFSTREVSLVWQGMKRGDISAGDEFFAAIIDSHIDRALQAEEGRARAAVANSRKRSATIAERIVAVAGALKDAGMIRQRIERRGARACELERTPSLKTIRAAMKKKGRFGSGSGDEPA